EDLPQIAAEALDARAGLFERAGRGRVGNAERLANPEWRALHHGDALGLQQFGDEIIVGRELFAGRRGLADGAGARRINIKSAFRLRALDAAGLIEHRDAQIAPLLEDLVVLGDEVLWPIERLDRRPLRHRRRVRRRLRLDYRHRLDQVLRPPGKADPPA